MRPDGPNKIDLLPYVPFSAEWLKKTRAACSRTLKFWTSPARRAKGSTAGAPGWTFTYDRIPVLNALVFTVLGVLVFVVAFAIVVNWRR